ncbi:MAG TPA: TadE/TadG family type IV pilus assembly protein [Dongiaceae bacterium]|jgi:Flp pilus assembly protein TadG|nr:TadE/TadG family type IV pilus assembly protein [Dongiaceae bacterium]
MRTFARLIRDQAGTTMIEFSIVMVLFFLLTFGLVEFGYMLFQWNSVSKAAQRGARLAAVSDPVWTPLTTLTSTGTAGAAWETAYNVTCQGTNATGSTGQCSGTSSTGYAAAAMQRLVFGPGGGTTCSATSATHAAGMCNFFGAIKPENVQINYRSTGLGFVGRPGGPVPTVALTVTGIPFQFIALGALLGFGDITMPDFTVTMTGEDLSAAAVPAL